MDPIDPADEREWEIHKAFKKKDKVIAALRADLAATNAELTRYRAMEEWLRSPLRIGKRTIKCRMQPSPASAESLSVTCQAFADADAEPLRPPWNSESRFVFLQNLRTIPH